MARLTPLPPIDDLRAAFSYDALSGQLRWTHHASVPARVRGKPALMSQGSNQYRFGRFRGQHLMQHRVIWAICAGEEPQEIDHIDGDVTNNRISNLRSVSHRDNCKHRRVYSTNRSGHPGVSWKASEGRWYACIHVDGKQKSLGLHDSIEGAVRARKEAEATHGYTRIGRHL